MHANINNKVVLPNNTNKKAPHSAVFLRVSNKLLLWQSTMQWQRPNENIGDLLSINEVKLPIISTVTKKQWRQHLRTYRVVHWVNTTLELMLHHDTELRAYSVKMFKKKVKMFAIVCTLHYRVKKAYLVKFRTPVIRRTQTTALVYTVVIIPSSTGRPNRHT